MMDSYPVLSLFGKSFFFLLREEGRAGDRGAKRKIEGTGKRKQMGGLRGWKQGRGWEGIDCSQAERTVCRAW